MLATLDKWLGRLGWWHVTMLAFVLVAAVGVVDAQVEYEVSLLLLYLVPIVIASWYAGRDVGISVALIASASTLWAALGPDPLAKHYFVIGWAVASRFGIFVVIATLLDLLHDRLRAEQQLARLDVLTGGLNRRAFLEQLQYNVDLAAREGFPFSLAYVDIDNFKQINDTRGHEGGDRVLIAIAGVLKQCSRRTDLVARLGGDEFAMLFPDTSQTGARNIITKIARTMANTFSNERPLVSCSIGVVTFTSAPADAAEAVRAADLLMYQVKSSGKNAIAFHQVDPGTPPRASADVNDVSTNGS